MAWVWRFEKADGSVAVTDSDPGDFGTQGDAESWIGEIWKDLLDEGVDQVTLLEDGSKVYGPMSLHEAADDS
ncbi:hypothetical protein N0X72_06765 [Streptomyces carpaticus]|uniref:Uncharacterized protein n=2 Tax=Streptomyces TaxID=1883 RepID=A0A1I6RTH2_9ACTN|nr:MULTISPECIES: hypothetical protein [Streptomyces]MCK1814958.1 hypothetical protein [Streptomyces sp. XM4011]QKV71994.1 hypothetical protein HUT13_06250 [Streptomyces harbinensis]UWM52445.1 hypothetical protein N0X72_06765 [Streptomyces carpaticus]SFS68011.1 hypothetical protein SAMN05444716_103383 [Streptomyces harbinensis]